MSNFVIINFNLRQLVVFYSHLGFSKVKTNYLLKKYILGFYYNISVINLNYTIFFFKSAIFIISNILSRNGRVLFFSEKPHLFYFNPIIPFFKFFNIYYCLKVWQTNVLTKLKSFLKHKYYDYEKFIFLDSIPDLILVTSYEFYHVIKNISLEAQKLLIPSINLIDTAHNPLFFNHILLTNLKSFKSNFFFLKIFEQIVIKNIFFIKQKFVFNILNFILENEKIIQV